MKGLKEEKIVEGDCFLSAGARKGETTNQDKMREDSAWDNPRSGHQKTEDCIQMDKLDVRLFGG